MYQVEHRFTGYGKSHFRFALRQRATSQAAEKLAFVTGLYQGMTSVVP
jgi:hypothetical protein